MVDERSTSRALHCTATAVGDRRTYFFFWSAGALGVSGVDSDSWSNLPSTFSHDFLARRCGEGGIGELSSCFGISFMKLPYLIFIGPPARERCNSSATAGGLTYQ